MKRFLILLLSITITIQIFGKQVTVEKAQIVATAFLINQKGTNIKSATQINLTLVAEITPQMQKQWSTQKGANSITPAYYIFNVNENEGFVIVSGDDAAIPILGYSNTNGIDVNNLPPAFIKWMEGYKKQIQYLRANNVATSEQAKNLWNNVGSTSNLKSTQSSVAPLIQTKWDQGKYYNNFCPRKYFWSKRAYTGCVATAMAQIMKYYNYPTQGTGFPEYYHSNDYVTYGTLSANFGATTYDWANMPNQLTEFTTTTQNDAVATLMYHCGVSLEMNYNIDGNLTSSAQTKDVVYALKNYFQYDNNITFISITDYYTSYGDRFLDEWKKTLKTELDNNRPMQYRGSSQSGGGHSFVCDGYDVNDFFHFNWGWSGMADDYYSLIALIPTETGIGAGLGEYTDGQSAIIGIKPKVGLDKQIGLYSSITIPTIYQLLPFDITASIANYGITDFTGSFCAAIFDNSGAFVDYIEIKTNQSLLAGYYKANVIFHSTGLALYPGTYYIAMYYKSADGNWIALQKHGFNNYVEVQVLSPFPARNLRLYDSIRISPNPIIKGQPLDVTFDIANYGTSTYNGKLAVGLYDIKGNLAELINYNNSFSLNAGNHFTNGLKFSTTGITSELGSYMIAVMEIPDGETIGYVVTPNNYLNPLMVNVSAPPLSQDPYEKNDTITSSYLLPVTFVDNNATVTTAGSNIHKSGDLDYFKLNLPSGYNYSIKARVHDSYNSGNGQTYTCDVFLSYKLTAEWSDLYDDFVPNPISMDNGGIANFAVMPYFIGATGTYLLELNITRSAIVATIANAATNLSQTSFSANWSGSATATGYRLDVATDIGFTTFVTGYNDKDVSNVTTYSITGLSANTPYYYRVRAYNTGGTGVSSNIITVTTLSTPVLSISTNSLTIAADANSTKTFDITSNISWTALSNQSWLVLSSNNGSGNSTLALAVTANPTTSTRTATVTISGTDVTAKTITVTQDGATPILSVSTNTLIIAAEANSTNTLDIMSNTNWTVSSSETWLTVSSASGNGNATVTFTAQANRTLTRTAIVTVSSVGLADKTITVTQDILTGINLTENDYIKSYPNPAKDFITIDLQGLTQKVNEIQIINIWGQQLMLINSQLNNQILYVPINNLPEGTYFLLFKMSNEIITRKIIIKK